MILRIYFNLNDTEDFVKKLKQLAQDDDLRKRIAAASKQRLMNNYTLKHHMDGLRKILYRNFKYPLNSGRKKNTIYLL